jgi:uncharacterized membrane protein
MPLAVFVVANVIIFILVIATEVLAQGGTWRALLSAAYSLIAMQAGYASGLLIQMLLKHLSVRRDAEARNARSTGLDGLP